MPVVHFHVVSPTDAQVSRLIGEGTRLYADCLQSPLDRVRVFVVRYEPGDVGVAGVPAEDQARSAPYFTALALRGRPAAQRDRLGREFTMLLADVFDLDVALVRGRVEQVDPDDWYIAGTPAAVTRAAEIAARAATH